MEKEIKKEIDRFEKMVVGNIHLDNGDLGDVSSHFYLIKMAIKDGTLRAPWCAIGNHSIAINQRGGRTYKLEEVLHLCFTFFNQAIGILNENIKLGIDKKLKRIPRAVILPRVDQHHLINSKIQYLKVLQERGYISRDTQLLKPVNDRGEWVNFRKEGNIRKIREYIQMFNKSGNWNGLPYPKSKMKDIKEAFKKGYVVVKLPYSGSSDCVIYPSYTNIKKHPNDYLYWLAVYLYNKYTNIDNIVFIGCLGFTQGLIIDRFNPYISTVGEFRCFIVDGNVIAITITSPNLKHDRFALRNDIKPGGTSSGEFFIYEHAVKEISKLFKNSGTLKKFWKNEEGDEVNIERLLIDPMKRMSSELNELLQLNCNRLDFVISHETLKGDFKLIINEIEDITYGEASIVKFMFSEDDLFLKEKQITLFEKHHPEKVELIRNVQQKVEMKCISDSDPFEAMDVGALIESFQSSSEGEKKSSRRSRSSSRRSRSSSRRSRPSSRRSRSSSRRSRSSSRRSRSSPRRSRSSSRRSKSKSMSI